MMTPPTTCPTMRRMTRPAHRRATFAPAPPLILMMLALILAAASGCVGVLGDSGGPSECSLTVVYTPNLTETSPAQPIRASALLDFFEGVAVYNWEVLHASAPVPFTPATPNSSAIEFLAPEAGIYRVRLTVQTASSCPSYDEDVNVLQPGVTLQSFRLRVVPPGSSSDVAPQDLSMTIPRGVEFAARPLQLLPALVRSGLVRTGGAGIPAYLRFAPSGTAGEPVAEVASGALGAFSARLPPSLHDVLVVPTGDHAPFAVARWDGSAQLDGPAGVVVSGEVRDPGGAALAGARVSLKVASVPSTVGTTDAAGAFTLRVQPGAGAELVVEPPAGSGLPRLRGAGLSLDLGQPLVIRYSASLLQRSIGGLLLQRQGAAAAGAEVTFVAELPQAGTIGGSSLAGAVRITATAGGDGRLPATQVPQVALSAVVRPAAGELAVLPFNAAVTPPASLDAPPMRQLSGTVLTPALAASGASKPAAGALVELIPQGALALAGVTAISTVVGPGGTFAAAAAPGGLYRAAITDPLGRGSRVVTAVTSPVPLGELRLALGWKVTGKLLPALAASPVRGAAVQLFCDSCAGVTQPDRPYSESVTGDDGTFVLVAPDVLTSANAP